MQGNKHFTPKLFTTVNLLDLVPEDNFYRKLMTALDLQFLREATRSYYGQVCVDDRHHVITGACADFADKRDSQCLEQLLDQCRQNLSAEEMPLGEILADAGYSSGEALKYLNDQNIEAWIPNFGQYIAQSVPDLFTTRRRIITAA